MNRIKQEKMTDSGSNLRYQFDHTYDSAGNRTALEISGNLQNPRNFGYTAGAMGHLTAISENTNLNNYAAAVTNDANGNITQVAETWNGQSQRLKPRLHISGTPRRFLTGNFSAMNNMHFRALKKEATSVAYSQACRSRSKSLA